MLIALVVLGTGAAGAAPTFRRDVAPILYARCVSCHRPGQIGPMPLLTYAQVRPWAASIRDEVAARTMPPWRADPRHGAFANDPRLTPDQIRTIVAWVEARAPEGGGRAPAPPRFPGDEWNIGRPDAVLAAPREFLVPARGEPELQYFVLDGSWPADRWVTAAEIRPGARNVVHHATVFVIPGPGGELPPAAGYGAACDKRAPAPPRKGALARDYLFSWSPGSPPFSAPAGAARLLPAGARLLLEVHYTTNGKPTSDRTRVGLAFAPGPTRARVDTIVAQNRAIVIPPNEADYRASACVELARPVTLLELKPHMHLRGREMTFTLVTPDGGRELLLAVRDWDFAWQLSYRLKSPRPLPAGARILVDARYDNSAANKANPAPEQEVLWDEWSSGEMLAGMITFVVAPDR